MKFPGYGRYVVMGAVGAGSGTTVARSCRKRPPSGCDLMIYTTEDCSMEDPVVARRWPKPRPRAPRTRLSLTATMPFYSKACSYDDPRPVPVYLLAKGDEPFTIIGGKHVP